MPDWKIFQGSHQSADAKLEQLLSVEAPSWRQFNDADNDTAWSQEEDDRYWQQLREMAANKIRDIRRGEKFQLRIDASPLASQDDQSSDSPKNPYEEVIEAVNAALYLRRPLMITGRPGSGKTSLAYAIAHELNLGSVLLWPITTRSILKDGLYQYDAIARLQDAQLSEQLVDLEGDDARTQAIREAAANFQDIGQYIRLGPVGTAFLPSRYPRVLLIDEIDKSDINLPNDLLNLFEEGEFEIPELKRLSRKGMEPTQSVESDDGLTVKISRGKVRCREFPLIIMTSNGERDFPPAFYRRCLRVNMPNPSEIALKAIVKAHLGENNVNLFDHVIKDFVSLQDSDELANLPTDQLLNLIYLFAKQPRSASQNLEKSTLRKLLFNPLDQSGNPDASATDV